jgi:hypothetical protein
MESKIEFKGCKYAVEDVNGFVMQFNSEPKITLNGIGIDDEMFFHDIWTLHTNPDHKESKEMKSDRLADEIMAKSKESVYTQEMKDKDLVPTEGMKFTYRKRDEEYTVLGVCESQNGKSTIITFEDFRNSIDCIYYSDDVLPIDQRTDSEKAVDDLMSKIGPVHYDAHIGNMSLNDVVKFAVELIEKGDVTGISFTGDKK